MEQVTGILGTLLIFGAIIAIHEFGHFIVAKLSKMGVHEFSLGFGPALLKHTVRGTLYALRIIPIGGYVRIAGMEPGDEDAPNGYPKKPFFAKFATLAAGATMNFVLAFVLIVILGMAIGQLKPGNKVIIGGVVPKSSAAAVDMRAGDQVVGVNDVTNPSIEQATTIIRGSNKPVKITLLREGKEVVVYPTPKRTLLPERDGFLYSMKPSHIIGVQFTTSSGQWKTVGFTQAARGGVMTVGGTMVDATAQFVSVVSGRIPFSQLSGPVGIMKVSYDVAKSDVISRMWLAKTFNLLVMLSMFIGFFNLLPIPALDGGRLLFLCIEGIWHKPISEATEQKIHAVGMALLLGLVALITVKDVLGLFGGR